PPVITQGRRAMAALGVAAVAALFPLTVAGSRPVVGPALGPAPGNGSSAPTAPLTDWLEAHGFSYGLSDYWSSSTVTLQSGDKVRLRAVAMVPGASGPFYVPHVPYWET